MNYNNPYYNPYQQYPYVANNYGNQPQTNNQQYQQPQQMQTSYLPLTFVNGVEGAKAFIVGANQTVYLKDSDSNMLYEKKADSQGKYTLNAFELKQIDINNVGKIQPSQNQNLDFLTKDDLKNYATLDDFSKLQIRLENSLDKVFARIDSLTQIKSNNNYNNKNNYKKESE